MVGTQYVCRREPLLTSGNTECGHDIAGRSSGN